MAAVGIPISESDSETNLSERSRESQLPISTLDELEELGDPILQPKPRLDTLPEETIHHVLGYVGAETLRHFRLSCRLLAQYSRPLLCRNINFTETSESFQRLLEICRHDDEIARSVRTLTYIPFTLRHQGLVWDILWKPPSFLASPDEFNELLDDRSKLARTGSNITVLVQALQYIKPRMIDVFDFQHPSRQSLKPTYYPNHALFKRLATRMPPWVACHIWSDEGPSPISHAVATRSFMAVLAALDQSSYAVPELKATTGLMMLMSPHIETFARAVGKLCKLDITIVLQESEANASRLPLAHNWDFLNFNETYPSVHWSTFSPGKTSPGTWTFGEFLARATSLRELVLCIKSQHERDTMLGDPENIIQQLPLIGFTLPCLVSLTLENVAFANEDLLLPLVAHAKTLRKLKIDSPTLWINAGDNTTSWPIFFKRFRKHVRERTIILDKLALAGACRTASRSRFLDTVGVYTVPELTYFCNDNAALREETGDVWAKSVEDFVLGITAECLWVYEYQLKDLIWGGCDLMKDDLEESADSDKAFDASRNERDSNGKGGPEGSKEDIEADLHSDSVASDEG